jgi:hypothetical protein
MPVTAAHFKHMLERPRVKKRLAYEKENLLGTRRKLRFKVAHREVIEAGRTSAVQLLFANIGALDSNVKSRECDPIRPPKISV